jgi:hypothetical protein
VATHSPAPAASKITGQKRRSAAHTTVPAVASHSGRSYSCRKRRIVPAIWSWRNSRGEPIASSADTNGRRFVIVGTPNHMNTIRAQPTPTIRRSSGRRSHR